MVIGQLFVALNFAELASHFPVAGSIYQWSKRLSNKTLGLFTGWFYFWAGVLTTTAVAITVPLVLSSILGVNGAGTFGPFSWNVWVALITLVITTVINAFGDPPDVDHQQPRRRRRDPRAWSSSRASC